jgi:hypothetical protein
MPPRPWVGVAVLGLLALLESPAHATISRALSLPELVDRADHVVLATCVDARAFRDGRRRIVTDYTVRVDEAVKGEARPGTTLTMRSLGGVIGDLGMRVEGEPHLTVGERYLLFLRALPDGRTLRPVGMSQGVMPVRDEGGIPTVQPGGGGMTLRQRVRGGQLVPAPPALLHPEPFPELRERMREMVDGASSGRVAP